MIDNNTEVWLNTDYPWSQPTYLNILSQLKARNVKFINPIVSNSTSNIRVIYPEISFSAKNPAPKKKINNSSVVYEICFGDYNMVFPGDIETEGWDEVNCSPYLNNATYYCLSHHGSLTGRIRNKCNYTAAPQNIHTIANCTGKTKLQILMGRNKAFPGIFSPKVLRDFPFVEITDGNFSYLELEWGTGIVTKV